MFIPYFMTALVFCGLIILINWSPFSQVAHLKVFSQQGFKGAVFPIFRGMLLFVSAFFFTLACVANVSSQVRQENWSKSENWDKRGLEKGRKGTLARNSTILKMLSPTNRASDWCGVVVLVEKWNVSSSLSPAPSSLFLALASTFAQYLNRKPLLCRLPLLVWTFVLHCNIFSTLSYTLFCTSLIGENIIGRSEACNITILNEVRLCLLGQRLSSQSRLLN